MNSDAFRSDLSENVLIGEILDRARHLDLSDVWLAGGSLFQTVWNKLSGHPPARGIRDYDLFYFDPDLSWSAENRVIEKAGTLFADLPSAVEIRNQARVHLWYPEKFGSTYPKLSRSTDGIDRFLMVCAMVGIQEGENGDGIVYAPQGVEDIYRFVVRPNPASPMASSERYREKTQRWKQLWPAIEILPWLDELHGNV